MSLAHLSIGTSADRINLLSGDFMLVDWEVGGTELDATFQESKLADFRQMVSYRDITTLETFHLSLRAAKQNNAALALQDMRRILRLVADYWTTTWQTSVVYLAARASCETNMRYAVVHDGRLVGESNPFGQPFLQASGYAMMDALNLIVERGPWLADIPGSEGTCVEISSQGPSVDLYSLEFDGVDDVINCGSDASIDNLPNANFTAEVWMRARDWGENGSGYIFDKTWWALRISPAFGIIAYAQYAPTIAYTYTGTDDFFPDDTWHHIAVVWTLADLQFDIAIDGVWVSTTIIPGVGAYTDDSAITFYIGNVPAGSQTFDGYMACPRISDSLRYTVGVDFTPPDRCTCPTVDGDTVALWCFTEGGGATVYDETANNNDGTISGAAWLWSGCDKEYMEATCEAQSVFVANKFNTSPVTHCYYWDDSATQWTDGVPSNLIGEATPFDFLPAVPNDDDFVMFGVNTALADTGPFCSLVFDISTAIDAGTAVMEWRYCASGDGADPANWTALTVQDNTNQWGRMTGYPFDTLGIGSVHWEQPSDWVTCDPDPTGANNIGVTGYWVCCYFDASGGAGVSPPEQDNRDIYTVTWPYMEFTADEVGGDMPALLRLGVDTRSATDADGTTTDLYSQRIVVGLRSMDRGEKFSAFINLADEQVPVGVGLTAGGGGSFQDWVQSPTGRALRYRSVALDTMDVRCYVALSSDWYGRFHAFVRCYQDHAGTVSVRLEVPAGTWGPFLDKKTVTRIIPTVDADVILDFGEVVIGPATNIAPYTMLGTNVNIEAFEPTGGVDVYFYDLILIPVDEWAIDCQDMFNNTGGPYFINGYRNTLAIDAIQNPRNMLTHLIYTTYNRIARYWRPITNGIPILQTGKHQRLWFLHGRFDDYADADDPRSDHEIASTIQVWKNQRYTTLRGDQ